MAVERGTDFSQSFADRIGGRVVVQIEVDQARDEHAAHLWEMYSIIVYVYMYIRVYRAQETNMFQLSITKA